MEDATRFYLFFLLLLYLKSYFIFNKKRSIEIGMKVITSDGMEKNSFPKKERKKFIH